MNPGFPNETGVDDGEVRAAEIEQWAESTLPSRRDLLSAIATVSTGAGLAGCSDVLSASGQTSLEATPVVLDVVGQELFHLPDFGIERQTETLSPSEEFGEVEVTSYLAVHSRLGDHEPPRRFDVPDPATRTIGILAMPSPDVIGEVLNPLASEPFGELLVGEHGRQLLRQTGVVDAPDFTWERQPSLIDARNIESFGAEVEAQSYLGIAVGDGAPATLLINLVRTQHQEDVILVGEFVRRPTPPEPIEVDPPCVDDLCQMPPPEQIDMWRRFQRAAEHAVQCTEVPIDGNVIEVCGSSSSTEDRTYPKFGVTNVRFVQHVENTVVKQSSGSAIHTEPDPDFVEGENTAVLFEFDRLENLDEMSEPLEITIYRGHTSPGSSASFRHSDSFELTKQDLEKVENGKHTISVLHEAANDSSTDNDLPVFEVGSSPLAVVSASNILRFDFWERISEHPDNVVDLDPLKVGFIRLVDDDGGARYGDSSGGLRDYRRSFESATEYVQRAFPGDVVTYGHTSHSIEGGYEEGWWEDQVGKECSGSCVIYRDMRYAKEQLDRVATDPSYPFNGPGFPNGGLLRLDGLDRSRMVNEIRNNGFDVVAVLVPGVATQNSGASDYYDYFDVGASGLAFGDSAAAVSAEGVAPSGNDQSTSTTVAQEIGHYFQSGVDVFTGNSGRNYLAPSGDPMAQRRNDSDNDDQASVNGKPIDPAHARNQNSNRVSGGDIPGVVSTAYDLEAGFANMQEYLNSGGSFSVTEPSSLEDSIDQVPSFMSYTGNDDSAWTDARIHRNLIDSGWNPAGTSGSGSRRYMLRAIGVVEDGAVRYGDVAAFPGVEEYMDREDAPVTVELLAPDGEVLARARVPVEVTTSHTHDDFAGGAVQLPSFSLPFIDEGVRIRTTYERSSTMNPIERSVRDAVRRVPPEGVRGEPRAAREAVDEPLDEVAAAMEAHAYEDAAGLMDGLVREQIRERVREYEAALNEPPLPELMDLVDEMVRRLRAIAEATQ